MRKYQGKFRKYSFIKKKILYQESNNAIILWHELKIAELKLKNPEKQNRR